MSFQAITWAFSQKPDSSASKFILICLANYADESFEAYPSVTTLSDLTGLDRKTVIAGLDKLESSHHIVDTGKRVGFTNSVKVYQLSGPKTGTSPEKGIPFFREAVPKTDGSSPGFPYKQSQKRYIEPIREPIREPVQEPPKPPDRVRSLRKPENVEEVIKRGDMIGVNEQDCRDWFRDCEACEWKRGDGTPFDNWPRQLVLHRQKLQEMRAKGIGGPTGKPLSILDLNTAIKFKEERANAIKEQYCSVGAMGNTWSNDAKRVEYCAIKKEIKELKSKVERITA